MKIDNQTCSAVSQRLTETISRTKPKVIQHQLTEFPSCQSIVEIVTLLRKLMFPGYCDSAEDPWDSLAGYVSRHMERVVPLIAQQIQIAIKLDYRESDSPLSDVETIEKSDELTARFTECLPEIRRKLSGDVEAAYVGDPACRNLSEVVLCYPGLQAVFVHRIAHELYRLDVPFLPRMLAEWVHGETGIDIHPGAQIGEHFFIDHGTGVVIGQTCVIGQHVKVYQGVTLGALSFPTDGSGALVRNTKRHPTIEDNVVIYANATVLGGNTIVGHDSVIGSSVWLTRSVEPFTTVVMEKPKLHLRNQAPDDFKPPLDYQI